MPRKDGRRINWYTRHWSDLSEVYGTVIEVAKAHARYLGYEVRSVEGYGPPPLDSGDVGPVMRVKLLVFKRSRKHGQPIHEILSVDVERRAGKFHPKTADRAPYPPYK